MSSRAQEDNASTLARVDKTSADLQAIAQRNRERGAETRHFREEAAAAAAADAKAAAKRAAKAAGVPKDTAENLTEAFGEAFAASCARLCQRVGVAYANSDAKADFPQGGNSTC